MIPLGLTPAQQRTYNEGLFMPHHRRIGVQILTLSGQVLRTITPPMIDGEVTVDVDGKPTRALSTTFVDPTHSLAFHPDDPGPIAVSRARMIRIWDNRLIPALGFWVDCPVFTGPFVTGERQGAEVRLTARGKEVQAVGDAPTRNFAKGTRKDAAIRTLLADTGEYDMAIPNRPAARLPDVLTVVRAKPAQTGSVSGPTFDQAPEYLVASDRWDAAERLGASMNMHLYTDGRGRVTLRPHPTAGWLSLDAGLLTPLTATSSSEEIVNVVVVKGKKPQGKPRITATAVLPPRHPHSPETLARSGVLFRISEVIDNEKIGTVAEAQAIANRRRDQLARLQVDYTFDIMPVPHLDELDLVGASDGITSIQTQMRKWTLPLGVGGAMSVGVLKRTMSAAATAGGGGKGGRHIFDQWGKGHHFKAGSVR